jgi:dipeptidyl aminopeptidase/acylaminoacyl peptidase
MTSHNFRSLVCFVLAGLTFAAAQSTSDRRRAEEVLSSMPHPARLEQVAISPDGSTLAWINNERIFVRPLSGTAPERTIAVPENRGIRDITWSHDSKQLAYIADEEGSIPASQIWVTNVFDGKDKKLADLKGYVATPKFSPDDKTLAFLFVANMPRKAGPLVPMTPPEGVMEEKIFEQRINTIDLASGALRAVSPDDLYVYEYDWAPDGKSWAATAAHGSGDNNWWIAHLYTIDAHSGHLHDLLKPQLQIAVPRFSPDGRNIAFISGIMSDEGSTGGDIFVIPATGGKERNLTSGMKASATGLNWISPDTIRFTENIDGNSGIATVSTKGNDEKTEWSDFESITAGRGTPISFASDGETSAMIRQSFSSAPEIWAGPIGKWKQITSINARIKPAWGEAKNVHWMSNGGKKDAQSLHIQGWLLFPENYDPRQQYPLVVTVHGGPAAACMPRFDSFNGALSALGYFVLCPNPRGSFGQGEAFTQANVKDFGYGDFHDIMAGIDSLAKQYPIDLSRLGIHGHSYGGYMTMWAETQTHRFKAAVAGAGLSNWLSYYGENDIDEWMIPYFGASVYDDPAVYAKSSPINFVKNVKTPTLILVGDRDGEVPAPQSFEWWHALKTLGVPVKLVVYPNEGHAIARPADRYDYELRTLEWFEKYLAEATGTMQSAGTDRP